MTPNVQHRAHPWALLIACLPLLLASATRAASNPDLDAVIDQSRAAKSGDDFLPPDKAFRFSAVPNGSNSLQLIWAIAPGYYLYRDRTKITATAAQASVGAPQFPAGQEKNDEYFGKQVIYHNELIVPLAVERRGAGALEVSVQATYQGCAEAGLCYPPTTRTVSVTLPPAGAAAAGGGAGASGAAGGGAIATATALKGPNHAAFVSEQDRYVQLLQSASLGTVLLYFFGGGLLLAFTPCVLPMVPILSGLIVGQGARITTTRAFFLSLTYVLGMAITYTITGAAIAAAGKQVQALFQQAWIIALFAAIFVAMALSMFGLFTVQVPSFVQSRLAQLSNRQRGGSFGGVAVMGMLSALIVTTCVGPVLVGALIFIGQSGDIARGSAALFAMGLGMGAPLLVVGSSAGRWLPRAGAWMDSVKRLFGALMLALAVWMLARVVPGRWVLALLAVPAFAAAVVLWSFVPARSARAVSMWIARGAAIAVSVYGVALLAGARLGAENPLQPLTRHAVSEEPAFINVASLADLNREVQAATAAHQAVMLDFYADWCTSCKEMQHSTFTDPMVRDELRHVRLLRADVTANNADDQALLHAFQIFGPPTIAFYDAQGHEHQEYRVVGYMKPDAFAALLRQALAAG